MLTRRRKIFALGGALLMCYLYIFTSSSSIDTFLRSKSTYRFSGNKKLISPAEGPVEDLLVDDNIQEQDRNEVNIVVRDLLNPFADDKPKEPNVDDWGKGFRVKPGFNNPLKRKIPEKPESVNLDPEDGIVDELGADQPRKELEVLKLPALPFHPDLKKQPENNVLLSALKFHPENDVSTGLPELQAWSVHPLLSKTIEFEGGDVPKVPQTIESEGKDDPNVPQTIEVEGKDDPNVPQTIEVEGKGDPNFPQTIESEGKDDPDVLQTEESETKDTDMGDGCIQVSKRKTYGAVEFPPFIERAKLGAPGENGRKYVFPANSLSAEERKQKEKDFNIHYFDVWLSQKIAVRRKLPDDRLEKCKRKIFGALPTASVLIVFYNEAWTTLLRTLHSILDRTPSHLLEEIILLDDFSDLEHLREPLEAYIQPMEKVKLFRAKQRLGLIRARNLIFEHSRGEAVVFLDSHVECFPGWLEPLLAPIHFDEKTVTFPTIEYINPYTFSVGVSKRITAVGGLNVNTLSFNWLYDRKLNETGSAENKPSPTMPGGLYAVSRSFFKKLGKYDPGMDFWGGENIEMSFKTWMCGGSILLVACSHVGHIFRHRNPALHGVVLGYKNAIRVAEVWMDHYKHYFYEKIAYSTRDYGDVSSRVALRESLQCHDFMWYLKYVFPELKKAMDVYSVYSGQIKTDAGDHCLDRASEARLATAACKDTSINQHWKLGTDGTIVSIERLIGVKKVTERGKEVYKPGIYHVGRYGSEVDVTWVFDDKRRLVHKKTGLCLEETKMREIVLAQCSTKSRQQKWKITTRKQLQQMFKEQNVPIDWSV